MISFQARSSFEEFWLVTKAVQVLLVVTGPSFQSQVSTWLLLIELISPVPLAGPHPQVHLKQGTSILTVQTEKYKPTTDQYKASCGRTDSVGTLGVAFDSYFPFLCSIYPITGSYVSFSVRYFRFSLFVCALCQHCHWHSVISWPASNSSLSIELSPVNFPNLYSILFSKQFSKMMLS